MGEGDEGGGGNGSHKLQLEEEHPGHEGGGEGGGLGGGGWGGGCGGVCGGGEDNVGGNEGGDGQKKGAWLGSLSHSFCAVL